MRFVKGVIGLVALAGAGILGGCKVGPDYKPPKMEVPSHFSEEGSATRPSTRSTTEPVAADMMEPDYQRWWESFNDPELNSLIDRASRSNLDIANAVAQIEQARAQRGVTAGGLFPSVDAVGNYTNSFTGPKVARGSNTPTGISTGGTSSFWQAGFDASWEIDLFGGVARSVEAADYSIEAQIQNRRAVTISTLAEVAEDYLDLRGAQRRLAIANSELAAQRETLRLTLSKEAAGLVPNLDVAQQEAVVATSAATLPTLETEVRQDIHALSILLGMEPGALSQELEKVTPIPVGPPAVPPGLPSDLLTRRPDVCQAERLLAVSTANIGSATANLFPKFSITGTLGTEAQKFGGLFDYGNRYYSIGPSVVWNVFDAGQTQYQIKVETALQAQALIAYRKAVLTALGDVDNALVAYNREQTRLSALKESVDANQRAERLSYELFQKGKIDFVTYLVAEQSLFTSQDQEISSEELVQADLVALYKALGGGWVITEPPAERK